MKIYSVNDNEFKMFGRVLSLDAESIINEAQKMEMPSEGSLYIPSCEEFEKLAIAQTIQNEYYGELPVQIGYCFGHSNALNALEWHSCSEINIAVTDMILLLGDVRDIEEGYRYNSENVKAFKLEKGQAIEVYATTLHFCPIETEKTGFGCVVGLLKGTNTPLDEAPANKVLFRKNKWLIAHVDNKALIDRGVVAGIYGENYKF